MSVDQSNVVDFIGIDKEDNVVLTISDHLFWDEENTHLLTLQNKINAYLGFIESGELFQAYPNAKNKHVTIRLVVKYKPHKDGKEFLRRVYHTLKEGGYQFKIMRLRTDESSEK